jgi:hypothetical protein
LILKAAFLVNPALNFGFTKQLFFNNSATYFKTAHYSTLLTSLPRHRRLYVAVVDAGAAAVLDAVDDRSPEKA